MITFYTSRYSPFCRAVKMLATHLGIPMNEVVTTPYVDTKNKKFLELNPHHKVPTIDDDGFVLWESHAILQYLCNRYAPESPLYPSEPRLRATVDRLLHFNLKTLSVSVVAAHFEFVLVDELSASRHETIVRLTDALTLLEIFMIGKDYVAGDQLTIADIACLASVTLLEVAVHFEISTYPNIWGWINRLRRELPYYDEQAKEALKELTKEIEEIREFHVEWSASHFCIFNQCTRHPNGLCNDGQVNGNEHPLL